MSDMGPFNLKATEMPVWLHFDFTHYYNYFIWIANQL